MRHLTIGRLAEQAGVNLETIRYYERIGLMPEPARSTGGHRSYDPEHLKRLLFIRRTRDLGFGTGVIRELISLSQPGQAVCREVKEIAEQQLSLVEERIRTLTELEGRLRAAVIACDTSPNTDCPIVADLGS
ncbi:helix-turn-helix domain-containing protein [uncultured Brevundimonas sp.]|uniref:MerR family transcriptional regulator n=1 Tax=uncultured Brevundimonas sp. TaxID=213418 RepID=UPI0025D615E0|nr:helix-turn-helix domain-containing protein [uncultured Brevundimonas sp.]